MKTLKKGDKCDEVARLQSLLNNNGYTLVEDGDFGPKTEEAVKAFQKQNNLEVDGIVGNKTWAALGVKETTNSTNSKQVDSSVIYAPLTKCVTKAPNRSIKYIVWHYTAGSSSAPGRAKGMKSSWEKTQRASADFGVDDRDICQFNPDLKNYNCWHCGDKLNPYSGGGKYHGKATNRNSIGIEICSNLKKGYDASKVGHEGWYYTEEALNNAVKLTKILMKKFNIPIENVIRHYDVSGKSCPAVVGWIPFQIKDINGKPTNRYSDESVWKKYKERLK